MFGPFHDKTDKSSVRTRHMCAAVFEWRSILEAGGCKYRPLVARIDMVEVDEHEEAATCWAHRTRA